MNIYRIKLFGAIFASFILTSIVLNIFFIGNSPRLRPNLGEYAASGISNHIISPLTNLVGSLTARVETADTSGNADANSIIKALESTQFTNQSPGVYSKQDDSSSYVVIKEQEVHWLAYSVDINGKQITVYVPQGEQPPTVDTIQKTLAQ